MGNWSQAGQGALGGAAAGAAFGPLGAGVGAGIGGLLGLLGGGGASDYQDQLKQLATQYGNRQAPQVGPAQTADYSGFRRNQAGLISNLEAMARGEGPSAAAIQMRNAMDQEAGAQASAAAGAGGRGVNTGAALRNAMNNTAALQAQNARDTGLMRVNEQLGAYGQLGGAIAQGRSADEGINQFNASQGNNMALANLQSKLSTLGLDQQGQLQALMAALGVAGPGLGTQVMAGGASALPSLLQAFGNRRSGPAAGAGAGAAGPMSNGLAPL